MPKHNTQELLAIDNYLQTYGHEKSFDNLVVLDGYIAALTCSKQFIKPSQWLNAIWGGTQNQPIWNNESDFIKFTHYVTNHFNYVKSAIAGETYSPMVYDVGESELEKCQPWCLGFIIGSQYWTQSIDDFDDMMDKHYGMITIFANKNPKKLLKKLKIEIDSKSFDIKKFLYTAVYIIDHYFRKNTAPIDKLTMAYNPNNAGIVTNMKIGRNQPCPCGSGKKYKKCCINN